MHPRARSTAPEGYEADAAFAVRLTGRRLDAIARERATVCGLWPDLTIALVNHAWWRFAEENGAPPDFAGRFGLGCAMGDGISGPQRPYYEIALRRVLETGRPWRHIYRCPSVTLDRTYHLEVIPVGDRRGLLLTHAPQGIVPHADRGDDVQADPASYLDARGLLRQCGHCRRVRRVDDPSRWDWVAAWIAAVPRRVSHELCRLCLELHYVES
ncbi:MAG TPA: hypothetical protein VF139_18735 [Candidatus Polarisedimenticolaceae bacterium]